MDCGYRPLNPPLPTFQPMTVTRRIKLPNPWMESVPRGTARNEAWTLKPVSPFVAGLSLFSSPNHRVGRVDESGLPQAISQVAIILTKSPFIRSRTF